MPTPMWKVRLIFTSSRCSAWTNLHGDSHVTQATHVNTFTNLSIRALIKYFMLGPLLGYREQHVLSVASVVDLLAVTTFLCKVACTEKGAVHSMPGGHRSKEKPDDHMTATVQMPPGKGSGTVHQEASMLCQSLRPVHMSWIAAWGWVFISPIQLGRPWVLFECGGTR